MFLLFVGLRISYVTEVVSPSEFRTLWYRGPMSEVLFD